MLLVGLLLLSARNCLVERSTRWMPGCVLLSRDGGRRTRLPTGYAAFGQGRFSSANVFDSNGLDLDCKAARCRRHAVGRPSADEVICTANAIL